MKIYDVTLPLSAALPVWPGDPAFQIESVTSIDDGDEFNVSALRLGSHTGTHVDAPRHLLAKGAAVDQLPLEILVGDAWVCRLPDSVQTITARDLEAAGIPEGTSRLLVATGNGALWDLSPWSFTEDYVALDGSAAMWAVDRGISLLGVDYLSVDPASGDPSAHRTLLSAGVVVVEGLDLRAVPEGAYRLLCLPLRLAGADGAPARVLLISE